MAAIRLPLPISKQCAEGRHHSLGALSVVGSEWCTARFICKRDGCEFLSSSVSKTTKRFACTHGGRSISKQSSKEITCSSSSASSESSVGKRVTATPGIRPPSSREEALQQARSAISTLSGRTLKPPIRSSGALPNLPSTEPPDMNTKGGKQQQQQRRKHKQLANKPQQDQTRQPRAIVEIPVVDDSWKSLTFLLEDIVEGLFSSWRNDASIAVCFCGENAEQMVSHALSATSFSPSRRFGEFNSSSSNAIDLGDVHASGKGRRGRREALKHPPIEAGTLSEAAAMALQVQEDLPHLQRRQQHPWPSSAIAFVVAPSMDDVNNLENFTRAFAPCPVILLNPSMAASPLQGGGEEAPTPIINGFLNTFFVCYCFFPISVSGILGQAEGALMTSAAQVDLLQGSHGRSSLAPGRR